MEERRTLVLEIGSDFRCVLQHGWDLEFCLVDDNECNENYSSLHL